MADNATTPPGAATAAVTPPASPTPVPATASTERLSVPASAVFGNEFTPTPTTPPGQVPPTETAEKVTETPATPAATPAATPKTETPATPAATPAAPAATPAATPAVTKVKVGDKEYTVAELEEAMRASKAAPAAPAAAPAAPAAPAVEVKPPTPEEVASQEAAWCAKLVTENKLTVPFSTEETETLLTGGDDAAKLISQKLTDILARSVLVARKSVYAELNPVMERVFNTLNPMVTQQQQLERIAVEQAYVASYPEYSSYMDTVRSVGQALVEKFPEQISKMTHAEYVAEVEAQSNAILQAQYKRFNPSATDTWKEAVKRTPAATAAPAVSTAAATAAPAAAIVPARAPAPAANSPAAIGSSAAPNFAKDTAKDLQG